MRPDFELGLPSELARRSPDIVQAESRLHSATAAIGVAVADLYPRITLNSSFGYESAAADRFSAWGSRRWATGPSLADAAGGAVRTGRQREPDGVQLVAIFKALGAPTVEP